MSASGSGIAVSDLGWRGRGRGRGRIVRRADGCGFEIGGLDNFINGELLGNKLDPSNFEI